MKGENPTIDEIRQAVLTTPKDKLTSTFYKKLLEAAETEIGSKKKAEKVEPPSFEESQGETETNGKTK